MDLLNNVLFKTTATLHRELTDDERALTCVVYGLTVAEVHASQKPKSMSKCMYCGEEKEYVPIIPKPSFYLYKTVRVSLPDGGKPICLKCFNEEIEQLKTFEEA